MALLSVLKWVFLAILATGVLSAGMTLLAAKRSNAPAKTTLVFETRTGSFGKLSIVKTTESRAKPGTVLVIPLLPIPIGGEYETVEAERLLYTNPAGVTKILPTRATDQSSLLLRDIIDAFYLNEHPFDENGGLNFLLPSDFHSDLAAIAQCLKLNRSDLEAQLKRTINAVAIVRPKSVAPEKEPVFFEDPSSPVSPEQLIGFEFTGSAFAALTILSRNKEGDHFRDYQDQLGEIFSGIDQDLIQAIHQLTQESFTERAHLNSPRAANGIQYRLYGKQKSDALRLTVFKALKKLPQMTSIAGNGVPFEQYYERLRDLATNRKRYLVQ